MAEYREILEGYVVDVACLRKYPREEWLDRAREHTRKCALIGHCLESGFALVDESGRASLLDSEATLPLADVVRSCEQEKGIRLRAVREQKDGEMQTVDVQLAPEPKFQATESTALSAEGKDQRRHWTEELTDCLSELQQSGDWNWPTRLAAVVEEIFADQSLAEPDRQEKAVAQVVAFYKREVREEITPALEHSLADTARLEVEDAFEKWKIEASVA